MDLKTLLGEAYKDGMTMEEINAALKDKELIEKSVLAQYVPKDTADKYASEAATFKKQLLSKQTDAEAKAAEEAAKQEAMAQELEALKQESTIAKHNARFLELKYDPALAASTAEALAKGDLETVFKNQALHTEAVEKAAKAGAMSNMDAPPATGTPSAALTAGVKLATELGKQAGQTNAQTNDVIKQYVGG